MDREIGSTDMSDMRVDAVGFPWAVDSAIRSRTPSNFGTSPIHRFALVVDNAIRSETASNFGTFPVHGYALAVDNAIRSGTASNLETFPVHGFSSAVDNAMRSSRTASNFGTSLVHGFASAEDTSTRTVSAQLSQVVSNATRHGGARLFTLAELKAATDNFLHHNMIGAGSFGVVYRAKLIDGREVAIKRGGAWSQRMGPVKFEFAILSGLLHHKHLVGVVGYCQEKNERLLVYEYMKNGSLYDHLHAKNNVDKGSSVLNSWKTRIKIALDASRGIEYLHNYDTVPHIHRDVKSCNILLDATWMARVSDFGSLTEASGTVGYIDPECYDGLNVLTAKSDVYGLGVVLLELLTGKRAIVKYGEDGSTPLLSVVDVAVPAILAQDMVKIFDPKVGPPDVSEALAVELVAYTAVHCVSLKGKNRPTMADIVLNLERALAICNNSSHDSIASSTISNFT